MRLLLTRAAEDAARTRAKLEASGHAVLVSPVLEIIGTGAAWPQGVVDALLATSGHAFAVWRDAGSPAVEARRLMPLFLVGARTAEVAREHGFLGAAVVMANATALALGLEQLAHGPKRVVYLAGRERKPDIEKALDVVGHSTEILEVYEARAATAISPETADALRAKKLDGVLHFSRRSAMLFRELAQSQGLDIDPVTHFCLSEDVAAPLREDGRATIKIAEAPNEAALLARLDQA